MSRHRDAHHRKVQSTGHEQVDQAEADWVAQSPIHHPVKIAVLRVVIVSFVTPKSFDSKQHSVDRHQRRRMALLRVARFSDALGKLVKYALVLVLIEVGEGRSRQQPSAFFEIQIFTATIAKGDEFRVGSLAIQLGDQFPRVLPDQSIAAVQARL